MRPGLPLGRLRAGRLDPVPKEPLAQRAGRRRRPDRPGHPFGHHDTLPAAPVWAGRVAGGTQGRVKAVLRVVATPTPVSRFRPVLVRHRPFHSRRS
ncbi:hypothetical protein GCM10027614_12610 [Micromonospora vulcania]